MSAEPITEVVDVPFSISAESGRLRTVFPVPSAQLPLTALLPILQQFTSAVASNAAAALGQQGKPVSCGPHCGACCRQIVPISPFEAEGLAEWIRSLPVEQQQAIAARFQAALVALQESAVLQQLTPEMFSLPPEQFKQLADAYFSASVACPFLIDESCSIHPIRPLVCREYTVVSPPAYCAEVGHSRVQGVVLPVRSSRALMQLGVRVEGDRQGWLPLIYLFHWMAANLRPGQSVSGSGPDLVKLFLETLAKQPGVVVEIGTPQASSS